MVVAEDMGNYYRVPADNRDLNYSIYFSEGRQEVAVKEDYNSHNTELQDVDGMAHLLLKLDCVQKALRGEKVEV
jgi:UDP-glucose 4-epimerase